MGRAALLAVDEDCEAGLIRLTESLTLEARLLISALGKYTPAALAPEDLWWPASRQPDPAAADEQVGRGGY